MEIRIKNMQRSFLALILIACSGMPIQTMHVFIPSATNFNYTYNGTYEAAYTRRKSLSSAEEAERLQKFKDGLAILANSLNRQFATVYADYAHVISVFPKEGPTAEIILNITMDQIPSSSEYTATYTYDVKHTSKKDLSTGEFLQLSKCKEKCEAIALAGSRQLFKLFCECADLLEFKKDAPTVEFNTKLFMQLS